MKNNTLLIITLVFFWFVCFVVQSSANVVHDHGLTSPFNSSKHKLKVHCDLNRHDLSNTYCPHRISKKQIENVVISSGCNGKTAATFPLFIMHAGNEYFFNTACFNFDLFLITKQLASFSLDVKFFLPKQIDHPPQYF